MDRKTLKIAPVEERLVSFFIDYFAAIFIAGFSFVALIRLSARVSWLSVILGIVYIFLKDIIGGQSIGKRILKIAVRDERDIEGEIKKSKLVLRNITTFILIFDFIYMLINKNNQKLGDKLGGTVVVKLTTKKDYDESQFLEKYETTLPRKEESKKSIIKLIAIIFIVTILFIGGLFFTIISVIKNGAAYKEAVYQIEHSEKIMNEVGEIEGYGYMPTGSVEIENGIGTAEFIIKVDGESKDIKVYVQLYKPLKEKWKVEVLEVLD